MAQFSKVFFPYDPLPAQDLNDIVSFMNGIADGSNVDFTEFAAFMTAEATGSSTVTNTQGDMLQAHIVNINSELSSRGGFSLASSGIVIPSNCYSVSVAGQVYFDSGVSNGTTLRVGVVNRTKGEVIVRSVTRAAANFVSLGTPAISAEVSPGDLIQLTASTASGSSVTQSSLDTLLSVSRL